MAKQLNFADLFSNASLNTFGTPLTTASIVTALFASFITGMFIYYIYKKTYSGVLYSKNFTVTLIMSTMVSSLIVMAIGGNLALSLGMIGALSIVRFRTPIKDPKDISYLFWAIAAGIVNGANFYELSVISSFIMGAVLIVLSKKIGFNNPYIAILKYSNASEEKINSALKKHCVKFQIRNNVLDESGIYEKTIETKIKEANVDKLLKELKDIDGVKKVMIFSHTGELSE